MSLTSGGFPDVSVAKCRSDFDFLFNTNARTVVRLRYTDTESGNYGADDETETETRTDIQLNIQGLSSDAAPQGKYGLSTAGSVLKAYAKYDLDIQPNDFIEMENTRYKIENINKSNKNGAPAEKETDVVFQEFNLVEVSKI